MPKLGNLNTINHYIKISKEESSPRYPDFNLVSICGKYFGKNSGKMLDFGCGTGSNLIHLCKQGFDLYGVDTSTFFIKNIKSTINKIPRLKKKISLKVLKKNYRKLPYKNNFFDYIVCVSVLSLLGSQKVIENVLSEIKRVMKPNAKIILDINGPKSHFVIYGKKKKKFLHEFSGIEQKHKPILCFCPNKLSDFEKIVKKFFFINEKGQASHNYLNYQSHEYIICASKK